MVSNRMLLSLVAGSQKEGAFAGGPFFYVSSLISISSIKFSSSNQVCKLNISRLK